MVLREIDRKIGIADALASCLRDNRNPVFVRHSYADMIRFRSMGIAAGYADGGKVKNGPAGIPSDNGQVSEPISLHER